MFSKTMARPAHIQKNFCRDVARTLEEHTMIGKKEAVLIGISGGPDSMALARVLMHLAPDWDLHLGLAHLHHGLRGASSDRDQAFTQQFAAMCNLPFFCEYRDVADMAKQARTSVEEAGRNARYTFFNQVADQKGFSRIATGHTRDDNAEQVLIGLLRGSGSKGLSGIPPVRENRIIRPLIDRSRQEILGFLDDLDQAYVMDDSNQDPAFLRNRIRTQLLPFLEKDYNPGIKQGLHRISSIFFHEDRLLDDHAARAFAGCVDSTTLETVVLSIPAVIRLHPALAPRVLRCAISKVKSTLRQITHDHIRAIQDLLATAAPGKHLDLPGRIRVYKTRDRIIIKKETMPLRQLGRMQKQARRLPPEA